MADITETKSNKRVSKVIKVTGVNSQENKISSYQSFDIFCKGQNVSPFLIPGTLASVTTGNPGQVLKSGEQVEAVWRLKKDGDKVPDLTILNPLFRIFALGLFSQLQRWEPSLNKHVYEYRKIPLQFIDYKSDMLAGGWKDLQAKSQFFISFPHPLQPSSLVHFTLKPSILPLSISANNARTEYRIRYFFDIVDYYNPIEQDVFFLSDIYGVAPSLRQDIQKEFPIIVP